MSRPAERKLKPLPKDQVDEAFRKFKIALSEGHGINLARKIACGQTFNRLAREIMKKPQYVKALNDYMEQIRKPYKYRREGLKLVCSKK